MIKYYKTVKSKACKPSAETTKKVLKFYNHDDIPSLPPCKNLARKLKDHLGVYHRIAMLVMEVSLINAFKSFEKDNASIKISQRTFEQLRPKSSTTPCPAAAVLLHLSHFDYIRKACNNLFVKNGKNIPFPNNETLVSSALCSPNSIKCIMSICQTYKSFPKIDALDISLLRCGKACIEEEKDCIELTIKVTQFERVTYIHKDKEKKKLKLLCQVD